MFDKFQAAFQVMNIQWSYSKEPFDLKQNNVDTTKQLYVHLTNVLL